MTDSPLDLSPLDPTRDRAAFDARVLAIARDAAKIARAPESTPLSTLASWTRPALAAAAVLIALALPPLVRGRSQPARPVTTADVLGVPRSLVELAASSTAPGVVDLAEALNTDGSHVR